MMEVSFDSGNRGENGACVSDRRGVKSAHYSRNLEASISSRVDCLEERLIETSNTLEKILEIVSSSAFGKVHMNSFSLNLQPSQFVGVASNRTEEKCDHSDF